MHTRKSENLSVSSLGVQSRAVVGGSGLRAVIRQSLRVGLACCLLLSVLGVVGSGPAFGMKHSDIGGEKSVSEVVKRFLEAKDRDQHFRDELSKARFGNAHRAEILEALPGPEGARLLSLITNQKELKKLWKGSMDSDLQDSVWPHLNENAKLLVESFLKEKKKQRLIEVQNKFNLQERIKVEQIWDELTPQEQQRLEQQEKERERQQRKGKQTTIKLLKALSLPELQPGHITTIAGNAGNGSAGFGGDNGLATSAQLHHPFGVFVTLDGHIFIADTYNHRVLRVSPQGVITTIAGNSTNGFSGDNGPATSAQLNHPFGVFVTLDGHLYIADTYNHRVRRVSPQGVITTIAGNRTQGFSGDNGPATSAQLHYPHGVFVSSDGHILITDTPNHRVRRVSPQGVITTIAGNGTQGFSGDNGPATSAQLNRPHGVFVTLDGHLYIADYYNHRVRRVTPQGVITTIAGNGTQGFSGDNGPATGAKLYNPGGVFVTLDGHLFIADAGNDRVRRVTPQGVITTIAGGGNGLGDNGLATSAQLSNPFRVFVSSDGHLYIADRGSNRVRVVNLNQNQEEKIWGQLTGTDKQTLSNQERQPLERERVEEEKKTTLKPFKALKLPPLKPGHITTIAGSDTEEFSSDNSLVTSAQLKNPYGLFVTLDGHIYIADYYNHRVRRVTPQGVITTVAGSGTAGFGGDNGPATSAQLNNPSGVFATLDGHLYIADTWNQRVRRVTPQGIITTIAGNGTNGFSGDNGPATSAQLHYPSGVFVSSDGHLYIADYSNHRVRRVTPEGVITTVAGSGTWGFGGDNGLATRAQLYYPVGVFVASDGHLFIADYGNHRVRRVTPQGVITTIAGNGQDEFGGDNGLATSAQLNHPRGVFVTLDGHLFIADQGNHRVRRVTPQGVITTIAGSGTQGFSGDNDLATSAQLDHPSGVFASSDNYLYIADQWNQRIRVVNLNQNNNN